MKILIACEYSGVVRDAFIKRGHDAMSCDILPTDAPGPHYQGDVMDIINDGWDLMIAHPPCTHLAVSGAKHFAKKRADGRQQQGIDFFMSLANAPIDRYAIENPVCIMSTIWRKPDQIIQPYQFGHTSRKTTCLWLKGLPDLIPTQIVEPELYVCKNGKTFSKDYMVALSAGEKRGHLRSKTYQGIADAMAQQWG
jgi:hypothetical protein